jgi:hypothetical protein
MRHVLPIVALLVAGAVTARSPAAHAEETDCDEIDLQVRLEEYLPTWCYSDSITDGDARAQFEATFVEGATSYAMVVSAEALARSYLPRQTLESLIAGILESDELDWHEGVGVDGYTAKRFAIVESSGRETNCIGFSENTSAPNGQPRTRLYGYLCNAERGEIEDGAFASFIAAIDG